METSMKNIDLVDISNITKKENINTSVIISDIKEITSIPKSLKNNVSAIIEVSCIFQINIQCIIVCIIFIEKIGSCSIN